MTVIASDVIKKRIFYFKQVLLNCLLWVLLECGESRKQMIFEHGADFEGLVRKTSDEIQNSLNKHNCVSIDLDKGSRMPKMER